MTRARRTASDRAETSAGSRRERTAGSSPRQRDASQSEGETRGAETGKEPVVIGLLAAPGIAHDLARRLARRLPDLLARRFPGVEWRVAVRTEPAAAASYDDVDLVEIAHQRMLAEGWKLAVCMTDFPLHVGNRPVTAHASFTYGVGLVSVPALGAVNLDDHVRQAVLRVIEGLLGESVDDPEGARDHKRHKRMRRRLEDLSSLTIGRPEVQGDDTFRFVAAVGLGNLRLLIGMVRANRPWGLIVGLSRAIVGALSVDIFGVVSPGVWIIADGLNWVRLLAIGLASILITCVSLIAAHRLWRKEYGDKPEARARTALFNLATALTVALGAIALYLALFVVNLVTAAVLITSGVLEHELGHPVGVGTYVALAWLVSSMATLGGALGAALENDRAVRLAAYGYHADARTEAIQQQGAQSQAG